MPSFQAVRAQAVAAQEEARAARAEAEAARGEADALRRQVEALRSESAASREQADALRAGSRGGPSPDRRRALRRGGIPGGRRGRPS